MRKILKRVTLLTLIAYAILAVSVLSIQSCVPLDFEMKPAKVDAFFEGKPHQPDFVMVDDGNREIHYVAAGDRGKPLVIFVHGSPGSWDAFIQFLGNGRLLEQARLVSMDRPGFGKSGRNQHEPSMAKQARALEAIIDHEGADGAVLVGHSLGGPVIARAAMDFPEKVKGLILVAPSIDPQLEKTKWYQYPAQWMVFSWFIPKVLLTTNREILPLKGELEAMLPLWSRVQMPVTVIQGGKDRLVPPGNADFADRVLPHNPPQQVRVAEMNHFVPWTHPELIEEAVLAQLKPSPP